jgi:hypothetical protein
MLNNSKLLILISALLLALQFDFTLQDIYLHNPRGSNNRLNERSANRVNPNRLFDSQVKEKRFSS